MSSWQHKKSAMGTCARACAHLCSSSSGTRVALKGAWPVPSAEGCSAARLPLTLRKSLHVARSRTRSLELAASVPHLSSSSFATCYCCSSTPLCLLSPPLASAPLSLRRSVRPSCEGLTHSAPPLSIAPTHCCSAWEHVLQHAPWDHSNGGGSGQEQTSVPPPEARQPAVHGQQHR